MNRHRIASLRSKYIACRKTLRDEEKRRKGQTFDVKNTLIAQELVTSIAQAVQTECHKQISRIVTKCLKAVFDRPYKFRIIFQRKRGQTEAKLVFIRKGKNLDPINECGGGPIDVAAFALRLACLLLQKPAKRRLLVLDEPFRFLSEKKDYRQKVADLLVALSEELKIQIVMVTHDPILAVGKIVEI